MASDPYGPLHYVPMGLYARPPNAPNYYNATPAPPADFSYCSDDDCSKWIYRIFSFGCAVGGTTMLIMSLGEWKVADAGQLAGGIVLMVLPIFSFLGCLCCHKTPNQKFSLQVTGCISITWDILWVIVALITGGFALPSSS